MSLRAPLSAIQLQQLVSLSISLILSFLHVSLYSIDDLAGLWYYHRVVFDLYRCTSTFTDVLFSGGGQPAIRSQYV